MKKTYFIISSAIVIAFCIIVILFSRSISTTMFSSFKESLEMFEEMENELIESGKIKSNKVDGNNTSDFLEQLFATDDADRINELFDATSEDFWVNYYQRYIIVTSAISIVISIITIIIARNNHVLRNRKRIIVYSIILFILGNGIISLIGLINFIVVLCLKRKDEDDYPIAKGKISPLEKMYRSKKEIILGIVAIVSYVLLYVVLRKALEVLIPSVFENMVYSSLIELAIDILVLAIVVLIYKDELLNGLRAFKSDFPNYRRFVRKCFIITVLATMVANVIRIIITNHTTSENQLLLFDLPFWYLAPIAVIWAPIVEECIFRGSLRRIIPNKYAFIIISGLIFGVLHAVAESNMFDVAITAIPYCLMGWGLAYAYAKSNNIITNILMHSLNNFMAIVMIFIAFGV